MGRENPQAGQAIVLIAIMLTVLIGMAAIAIDGARAYALRRDLQAAVDAAALAAGDKLQQTHSYPSAELAASTLFGTNLRLYTSPSCSPAYGSPGPTSFTVTCTYSDGTVLTQVVSALGPQGSQFTLTATRSLQLMFANILVNGSVPRLGATASGGVNNLLYAPTIAALSQAGCGGLAGTAINTTTAGQTLGVVGDVVSNGAISIVGSAQVTGDVYARCQSSVANLVTTCYPSGNSPPCAYPDVAGAIRSGYTFVDPSYPPPPIVGGPQGMPANDVTLSPGTYAVDPAFSLGRCYFLDGGAYKWQGGYTNYGGFVSNKLRPPDEPMYNNNTTLALHQFWNTNSVNCAGSFRLNSVAGPTMREGTWAIVITALRTTVYAGVSYLRESAPSICRTVIVGDSQSIQVQISNVAGATSYRVYAALPSVGCVGPFGLAGTISVTGAVQNNSTVGCPVYTGAGCSLGNESAVFDTTLLGLSFAPNSLALPGVVGSYPPTGETAPLRSNLPNEDPSRATPPAGDRANENQCDTVAAALTSCPGPITPGAVVFYIPSGGCLNDTSNGDNVVFSGYQYNWMAVYEPGNAWPPANTCSNFLGAATDSAFIGLVYTPSASITVRKASTFRTDESGGVIAYTLTFTGQLPTIIGDPVNYGATLQASRLST